MTKYFTGFLTRLLDAFLDGVILHKAKHITFSFFAIFNLFKNSNARDISSDKKDQIVVVGIGVAAYTLLKELKHYGYKNVIIISRDDFYGGKCVNFGCMPTQYTLSLDKTVVEEKQRLVQLFISNLKQQVIHEFNNFGYRFIKAEVKNIKKTKVILVNNKSISFDKLFIATGNQYPQQNFVDVPAEKLLTLEKFWDINLSSKIVIMARDNPWAVSLAVVAKKLGYQPLLTISGQSPLMNCPSYQYFIKNIQNQGIEAYIDSRILRVSEDELVIDFNGGHKTIPYDYFMDLSKPQPNIPSIDNIQYSIFDMDHTRSSLSKRPDIHFLGDAAGYFSASEAENQAFLLGQYLAHGKILDMNRIIETPMIIDAEEPLAITGSLTSFFAKDWREIDFRCLGVSAIYNFDGKVWYRFNAATAKIESIHICHRNAGELISLAKLLIEYPVWHENWLTSIHHPTFAEIFKVIAKECVHELKIKKTITSKGLIQNLTFKLPYYDNLTPKGPLPDWLSKEDAIGVITSKNPRQSLAIIYAHHKLFEHEPCNTKDQNQDNIFISEYPEQCYSEVVRGNLSVRIYY